MILTEEDRHQLEDSLEQVIGKHAFDAIEAAVLEKLASKKPDAWMYLHKYKKNNLLRFDRCDEPDRNVEGWTENPLYSLKGLT